MASQEARHCRGGSAVWLLGLLLAAGLTGCSGVIETFRSASGINKNDPDPATAPFTENLDKAEARPFPNLATVPAIPIVASTVAERQKLAENLTGARTSVEANGGTAAPGPVPPPPEVPASIAAPAVVGPPVTPKPPTQVARRAMDEPPPPLPQNTTMQTPTISAAPPGVEAARPAPPQGHVQGIPRPDTSVLPPAALQSANPQPAPPVAVLPPPQVSPQVAALPPPKLPPVPTTVTSVDLPPGTTGLPADMRTRLADVVAQYNDKPRTVRVVSYAVPGTGGAEQLNNFRAALDRAQLIAKALGEAGIPANKIQTEASPAVAGAPTGRIDIQLLP